MLDAYASYLRAMAQPAQAGAQRDTRTAARTARTNAQASIDRMRTEPATPPELLALARALFANGNRLARTAMTLEALLHDLATLSGQTEISRFIEHAADALRTIAAALREQRAIDPLPPLRAMQRTLVGITQNAGDRAAAELLARVTDRLVDNIDTLAYVANRGRPELATATEPRPS
jgi:hypothetical protein